MTGKAYFWSFFAWSEWLLEGMKNKIVKSGSRLPFYINWHLRYDKMVLMTWQEDTNVQAILAYFSKGVMIAF